MSNDDLVAIRQQPLSTQVIADRESQRLADVANEATVDERVAAHLRVGESVLDALNGEHRRLIEETDFDPLQRTRQSAAWLLAGRCISLGYGVTAVLRAGLTTEMAPLARTLHEACAAVRIMLDGDETTLHQKWLRDGYFSPKILNEAQKRMEERTAIQMLRQGFKPVGRTDELDRQLYDQWSRIAHNRRSGILENYSADLRTLTVRVSTEPLRRGVWVGYGTQVLCEVIVTVGGALAKMLGPGTWVAHVEPAIDALHRLQERYPLDPDALGFGSPPAASTGTSPQG